MQERFFYFDLLSHVQYYTADSIVLVDLLELPFSAETEASKASKCAQRSLPTFLRSVDKLDLYFFATMVIVLI